MSSNILVGAGGEAFAQIRFRGVGYDVTCPTEKNRGDLRIKHPITGEVIRVEVKTSRQGKDGRWKVCLNRGAKTSVRHADAVLIQLVTCSGRVVSYFIPSNVISHKTNLQWRNPETPNSKWAEYRIQNYAVMGGVA